MMKTIFVVDDNDVKLSFVNNVLKTHYIFYLL
jgi:hypothetical protein